MKFCLTNLMLHGSHCSYPSRRRACFKSTTYRPPITKPFQGSFIKAVTDPIFTKLFWPNCFWGLNSIGPNFLWIKILVDPNFLAPNLFCTQFFFTQIIFFYTIFLPKFFTPISLYPKFCFQFKKVFGPKYFFLIKILSDSTFFRPTIYLDPEYFLDHNLFYQNPKSFWTKIFFRPNIFIPKIFWTKIFFWHIIFLDPTFFWTKTVLDPKLFWIQTLRPKIFWDP